jgi:ABC-type iron transport system FetAB permease component
MDFFDLSQLVLRFLKRYLYNSNQVFVVLCILSVAIFMTSQFYPVRWTNQTIFWSIFIEIGTTTMISSTYF